MIYGIIKFIGSAFATFLISANFVLADEVIEEIPFGDQTITISDTGEGEQYITLNSEELARNFFASFDRVTNIEGINVAIFYVSDGGNACGPTTLLIWQEFEDEAVNKFEIDDGCDTPAPSVSDDAIFFIPYLKPGESKILKSWSPSDGLVSKGMLSYSPKADSNWTDFKVNQATHPIDFFKNEAIYNAAKHLTGDDFAAFVKGLSVASNPRILQNGLILASGCTPHNCGALDSMILVDRENKSLFLAQQHEGNYRYWPAKESWPATANEAYDIFIKSR